MSKFSVRRDHHGTGIQNHLNKYIGYKVQGTGIDPRGTFNEFLKKDIKTNIDIHRDTVKRIDDLESRKNVVAVGCTKKFPDKTAKKQEPVKYTLETDHVSFKNPESISLRHSQSTVFSKTAQTALDARNGWAPHTSKTSLVNNLSTNYNIITLQETQSRPFKQISSIDARRSKGLAEYSDLAKNTNTKFNPEFARTISEDPKHFYRKTGIFSNMYDAAARHGNITMPFDYSQDFGGKPAFKC